MIYRIKLGDVSETRRRSDAASLLARNLAYDAIRARGGLDTKWGRETMEQVEAIDPHHGGSVDVGLNVLYVTPSRG